MAKLKFQTKYTKSFMDRGMLKVPVYSTQPNSQSDLKVATGSSNTAFIKLLDPANARYPILRTYTDGSVHAFETEGDLWSGNKTIDAFEDNDISEYGGETEEFYVDKNGSPINSILVHDADTRNSQLKGASEIESRSGLQNYPDAGNGIRLGRVHTAGDNERMAFQWARATRGGNRMQINVGEQKFIIENNDTNERWETGISVGEGLQNMAVWWRDDGSFKAWFNKSSPVLEKTPDVSAGSNSLITTDDGSVAFMVDNIDSTKYSDPLERPYFSWADLSYIITM